MSITVKRVDSSSYFPSGFEALERSRLEEIPGINYCGTNDPTPTSGELLLLTNTHTKLAQYKSLIPRVLAILHPNSGFDNLLPDFETFREIPIVLGNSIRAQAVAEWVMAALFQHHTFIRHHSCWPQSREWPRSLIQGQKILLVGFGHVGKILAPLLQSLGAELTIHDPFENRVANLKVSYRTVILTASLNPSSRHLLNEDFFATAANDLLLINPARGELINEGALRNFLQSNPQARAILDVHQQEPYATDYWRELNVTATPHIAGVSERLIEDMLAFESHAIKQIVSNDYKMLSLLASRMTTQGFLR